ncbi:MAG: MBL fold metallo-hydrolase [Patescibacteria group bacterium]
MTRKNNYNALVITLLFGLFAFVWGNILFTKTNSHPAFYFLDVGQGDASLVVLPGGVKIMTDAGPDQKVVKSLERAIGDDTYIDIGIISHPQLDHFNGFNYLLEKYRFGAFVVNGRDDTSGVQEWPELLRKIRARSIPIITLRAGDGISYRSSSIDIISPNRDYLQSGELNDTGLVELIKIDSARAIFAADIGASVEEYISKNFDIRADILKVPHHGSKYSSSEAFLEAVNPQIAIIEVGKNNYGHPAPEAFSRLKKATDNIFTTKENGTIRVEIQGEKLRIYTERGN